MWVRSYGRKSRVLGDPDTEEVVAHQLQACDRWAAALGFTLEPWQRLSEVGSGESLTERPKLKAELEALERRAPTGGGILIVTEVARISRADMEEFGRIIRVLQTAGIRPCVAGRLFDLTLPDDREWFEHLALRARAELHRFKWRVGLTMDRQLREGTVRLGAKAWGYLWDKNAERLKPHPEQFPVLVACCRAVLTTGVRQLARHYGVPISTLQTALSNPTICGWPSIHWGPDPRHPGLYRRLPRHLWRWAGQQNDTYPHACTRAHFEQMQTVMAERKKRSIRTTGLEGWCRDLVTFEGHPGRARLNTCRIGAAKLVTPVYERRENGLRVAFIERSLVHAAAEAFLFAAVADPARMAAVAADYHRAQTLPESASQTAVQLADTRRRYEEAVDAEFDAEEPLRSALRVRRERLEGEVKALQRAAGGEHRRAAAAAGVTALLEQLPELARTLTGDWPTLADAERRALANLFLQRVEVRCSRGPSGKITGREVAQVVPQPWIEDVATA